MGNPTSYHNGTGRWNYTWDGRELTSAVLKGAATPSSYTYDANGLRTTKTVVSASGTAVHTYLYAGDGTLIREIVANPDGTTDTMEFLYDHAGQPYAFVLNNTTYYYVVNLQGDVVRIVDGWGRAHATYVYNAWGKLLSATAGSFSGDQKLTTLNPLRYRGYYYDTDTQLYYLQSRYYDPNLGRFLNADSYASTGQGIIGNNMFAYCNNNPVNMADYSGNWPQWIEDAWEAIKDFFSSDTNSTGGEFEDGIFRGSGSLTGGYSEVNGRLQVNSKNSKNNGMLGAFGKVSVGNTSGKVGIGNNDVSLSIKGVGDGLTASAQAGIQYKNGAGLAAKAKAAVLSGRVTAELDLFGWQIEIGVSGDLLSVGAEAMIGVFPNEGFTAKASVGAGLFGVGFVFRVKPAQ